MDNTVNSPYKIKQGTFEGPLELLLSLIEQKKLFINEISLALVTNDYISHIKEFSNTGDNNNKYIADISYFILVATTLILIKSKSLLPNLALTEDETEKISDLENRLKLYKIIKNASIDIKNNFGVNIIFMPNERIWSEPIFAPDPQITLLNISSRMDEIFRSLPTNAPKLPEIEIKKILNIDQIINSLTDRIKGAIDLSFKEFSNSHGANNQQEAKVHIIVSFLAMLELVREGIIDVIQSNSFDDIKINKQEIAIESLSIK
jgi:segregation and condensation protein A